MRKTNTLGRAYNELKDAKETARSKWVFIVTVLYYYFSNFWRTRVLFMGPLIPLV